VGEVEKHPELLNYKILPILVGIEKAWSEVTFKVITIISSSLESVLDMII